MSKKLLIIVAILAGLLMIGPFLLSAFVSRDAVQRDVVVAFKAWSGLDIEVQGNTSVEGYPFPHVVMRSLVVHNVQEGSNPFFITIRSLELYPSLSAIFSGKRAFASVKLDGVNLSLEQLKDKSFNWKKLTSVGVGEATIVPDLFAQDVHIDNASITYTDNIAGTSRTWDNIHVLLLPGTQAESSIRAGFHYGNRDITAEGQVSGLSNILATGALYTNITLTSGHTQITYRGDAGMKADSLYLKGEAGLNSDDITPWYMYVCKHVEDSDKLPSADAKGKSFISLPLQAHSSVLAENGKISVTDMDLSGPVVSGKLQLSIEQQLTHWQLAGELAELNLESVLASRIFVASPGSAIQKPAMDADSTTDNPLVMSADVKVDDIDYNSQHITETHVAFDLEDNEAVFSQATALFPGNSRVVFNGLGKALDTGGISLEGQIDVAGDDFFAFSRLPKWKGAPLPSSDLKRFRIKTNAVISPKELRFSELATRIEAIALTGGIVVTLDDRPKVQAELRIAGADLDHFFLDSGLTKFSTIMFSENANRDAALEEGYKTLQWLKEVDFDLQLSTYLSYTTFEGKNQNDISGDIYITTGKLAVNRLKTNFNNTQVTAEVVLDILNPTPRLSLMLNADSINIPVAENAAVHPADNSRWSSFPFNFYWLNHVDSTYAISVDHLKYGTFTVDNLSVKGGLDNNVLHIDDMKGIMLEAPFAARLSVRGGRIPFIEMAANLENMQAEKIAPYVSLLSSMKGNYSITTRLSMSGESMANWVSTLNGTIGIAGTNVLIHGFNMPGIIRAVAYVRTVADILNVVKHAFPGGDTLFSAINGNWTISEGKMDISNTKLSNPDANGVITGIMDLPNWDTQQKITFDLLALDRQKPPSISIQLRGNMDAPEKILDTHALEQYVTEKTAGKLLNDNP